MRLVSPTNSPNSGRVEVFYNGTWRTICDNSWDLKDADVVCRQLGCDGALTAYGDAAFGQGTGQIWLTDVQCVGDETSIFECNHRGWGIHNCGHNSDASAVCRLAGKKRFIKNWFMCSGKFGEHERSLRVARHFFEKCYYFKTNLLNKTFGTYQHLI